MDEFPAEFWQGIATFNQGEYYACHDLLEALWIEAVEPEKTLYQGILQIAVALYHLDNLNWRGAVILLGEGLHRLSRYPDEYDTIDLGQLRTDAAQTLSKLQSIDETTWAESGAILSTEIPRPIVQKVPSSL
ncbi:MAG: DUF309 domain-containing protein [Alkalinema sp. RU_4_3]|nr:DUF309 domain-containing protein [Alkalinema sp. RU_4_3]